jgi:hypothetical protein
MFIKTLNTVGIIVVLIGVIILFRYGMPFRVKTGGVTYIITEQIDEAEKKLDARYALYGYFGLSIWI